LATFGPLVEAEWYVDVSAPGHCPVRALLDMSEAFGDSSLPEVALFPSRPRHGRILIHDAPPPPGTTLLVDVRAPGFMEVPTFYRVNSDGSFDVNEPIDAEIVYTATLPDGRSRSVRRSEFPDERRVIDPTAD